MKPALRNAVFLLMIAAAVAAISARMLRRPEFKAPTSANISPTISETAAKVDAAFEAEWSRKGLRPTAPAPDLAIARRLSLALTGTIPSVEEIRAFEQQPAAGRVQWWLSHLFEDRRFGDYVGERLARAAVGVEDGPFIVYRRRRFVNWMSDQLMANRPYDEIVRKMITAQGIWTSKPEVNFITVTVDQNNEAEGPDQVKLAGRVAKAFLGVRLDCVECHNDFTGGSWKQADFHQLAAFFVQSEMSLTGVRDDPKEHYEYRYNGRTKAEPIVASAPFNHELLPAEGPLRDRLAAWVTHRENKPFARAIVNRVWALMFNKPLHAPVDNIPLEGELPPALEILADDLVANGFDLHRLIRTVAATRVFRLDSRAADGEHPVTAEQEAAFAAFPLTRLRPEQVAGAILQSAKLSTIDANSHVLVRAVRFFEENDFVKRYGDAGENEFGETGGTIPQRLVMMNGKLTHERTKEDLLMNASTRIAATAPDTETAIETAYLAALTRRPTSEERAHFLRDRDAKRGKLMEDLFWTLLNSTEFSWNH